MLGLDVGEYLIGRTAGRSAFPYHVEPTLDFGLLRGTEFEISRPVQTQDEVVSEASALAGRHSHHFASDFLYRTHD